MDSIPGITITLITTDHKTNVEGKLTANGELVYTMQFSITAEQAYWQKENTIDSANNNKYLDLACYLMDAEKKERVPLPAGTNFQYRLEDGSSYSDLQMIPDRSGIRQCGTSMAKRIPNSSSAVWMRTAKPLV